MTTVDVGGNGQFSADSQPKSIDLVRWLAATRRSVYIHQVLATRLLRALVSWFNSRLKQHPEQLGYAFDSRSVVRFVFN